MTTSSSAALERGVDTMVLVYSVLQGHPAATACEQLLRGQSGWFTSALILLEAKSILTKVYSVDGAAATQKLAQLPGVVVLDLDQTTVWSACQLADAQGLQLSDAVLLHHACQQQARELVTEDQRLARACAQLGITAVAALDPALRQQVAAWEALHVPRKGLSRVLHRIHQWLNQNHAQAGQDFWSATGSGSHLP